MTLPTDLPHIWTPDTRVAFLRALAIDGTVRAACAAAGMSREAAYTLRRRNDGLAFALGWEAALLIARDALSDLLLERAIEGQEDVIEWDEDRRTRTRRRHDNRLALSLLGRLDRFAESDHALHRDARVIGQDWEGFLALVTAAADDDAIRAFLGTAPPALEQCQPPDEIAVPMRVTHHADCKYDVWQPTDWDGFQTNFPPPPGFDGEEDGIAGTNDYVRDCTPEENEAEHARLDALLDIFLTQGERARRQRFGLDVDEGGQNGD